MTLNTHDLNGGGVLPIKHCKLMKCNQTDRGGQLNFVEIEYERA